MKRNLPNRIRRDAITSLIGFVVGGTGYIAWAVNDDLPIGMHIFAIGLLLLFGVEIPGLFLRHKANTPNESVGSQGSRKDSKTTRPTTWQNYDFELRSYEGDEFFAADIRHDDGLVEVRVVSTNENALAAAKQLLAQWDRFLSSLQMFLTEQAQKRTKWASEIVRLRLTMVDMGISTNPSSAELYFEDDATGIAWTCGYREGGFFDLAAE